MVALQVLISASSRSRSNSNKGWELSFPLTGQNLSHSHSPPKKIRRLQFSFLKKHYSCWKKILGVPNIHIFKLLASLFHATDAALYQLLHIKSFWQPRKHTFVCAREKHEYTHTHRYLLTQKHTTIQHSNIWDELWPLLKKKKKKKKSTLKQQSGTDPAVIWLSSQKSTICSNKTPLVGSHLKVTWKIILRWNTFIHVFYDLWWPYGSSSEWTLKIKSMLIQKMEKKISYIHPHMCGGFFLHSKQSPSALPFAFPI